MKRLFVFILVFSIHSIYAQDVESGDNPTKECADSSSKKLESAPETEDSIVELEKIANHDSKKFKLLVADLCNQLIRSHSDADDNPKEKFEKHILKYLGIFGSPKDPPRKHDQKIAEFWNENSSCFICDNNVEGVSRVKQHLLKRAVDLEYHTFIFQMFLMKYKEPKVNFNAIEIHSGEKETIIDYLDKILAGEMGNKEYTTSSIQNLRDTLYNYFGARTANQLE